MPLSTTYFLLNITLSAVSFKQNYFGVQFWFHEKCNTMRAMAMTKQPTHQNLMGIHWPRQEKGSIVWRVELVTKDVNGGNPLYVVLCA